MQFSQIFASILLLLAAASATDLRVKVVDPRSAAVAGAQVELLQQNKLISIATTSAEGFAVFRNPDQGPYRVRILAPGFAPLTADDLHPSATPVTLGLRLASASETVVVSATRGPVPGEAAGAVVESLNGGQLQAMDPVATNEALRYLPGTVIETAGQRGGLSSLFVRGGDSRYNKVIVDGVPINEPGGTFDFGVVPMNETDRMEFVRGAQSTLYGSDAMTGVVQLWTRSGSTPVPELRFGADGGNFNTANGYASLAGAHGPLDYNLFADQFNTTGQGVNDDYSNSLQGANLGVAFSERVSLRVRVRHSNNRTGVSGAWDFNGAALEPPDSDQWARQNNLLGSAELTLTGPSRWQHRFTGFEYSHQRTNVDVFADPGRVFDFPTHAIADINRAGFEYQGDYQARIWARTTVGYEFEDENGFVGDLDFPPLVHGLRLNHAIYGQELLTLGRVSLVLGARFVHNQTFGNKAVPRAALTVQALKGGGVLSGTQLRFSYATGIKEPRLEESFARGFGIVPNPNLKAEENRAFEAGFQQSFFGGKYAFTATYFHNLFRHQIDFAILDPVTFTGQYENIDKSMAHGAELELHARPCSRLSLDAGYNYTSTQILEQPFAFDPLHEPGQPLLRRPRHSGSLLLTWLGSRWGGNLGGSFVGRRPDSDFSGFGITHAAGYARLDVGGWYALNPRITAYVNIENALDKQYNEVVGYPALGVNFRAGMRFRLGGE
ncbi:MAG TPA: TonB-dependent receptor [Terriglobales bacterium]|jgi:outer membrane cobalamin receptor|nr:TonB-dependent receptor [Terriglobales bacterium]